MYKPTLYLEGEDYHAMRDALQSLVRDDGCPPDPPHDFESTLRHLTYLKTSSWPVKLLSPYALLSRLIYSAKLTEAEHKLLNEVCMALEIPYPTHLLLYINQSSLGKPTLHDSAFHPMFFPRVPTTYLFKVCCFPSDLPPSIRTIIRENIFPAGEILPASHPSS